MSLENVLIDQTVAILIDGNNIERSLHNLVDDKNAMLNFDILIPKLLDNRGLSRLIYFREGVSISAKLADRLHQHYHGSVVPCHKSADIPLSIKATQIAPKVDTIIILSGDSDYVELVRHLKSDGVRVEIAAVPATTADILRVEADFFIPITKEDCFSLRSNSPASSRGNTRNTPAKNNNSGANNSNAKSNGNGANNSNAKNNGGKDQTDNSSAAKKKPTPRKPAAKNTNTNNNKGNGNKQEEKSESKDEKPAAKSKGNTRRTTRGRPPKSKAAASKANTNASNQKGKESAPVKGTPEKQAPVVAKSNPSPPAGGGTKKKQGSISGLFSGFLKKSGS